MSSARKDNPDTFRILLATDCHLGYEAKTKRLYFHRRLKIHRGQHVSGHGIYHENEISKSISLTEDYSFCEFREFNFRKIFILQKKKLVRKFHSNAQDMDSFVTFEEILQLAHEKDVDFILLGGDLFHDCRPSQRVVLDCLDLLKKYCLGTRPISIKFLSNPDEIFVHSEHKVVNYENENLNISMPVFSIHGNHDNPSFESTATLDLLMASGLVNYFGKWSNLQEITVTPMVFQKGESYIAIYGLGHVGEQRLSRLFKEGKVTFLQPQNLPQSPFNILVIHQNRARHTENSYIAEDQLPGWFDLIFWGHEHECRINPEEVTPKGGGTYYVCQPGSSVATSLCEGESREKHIGILSVRRGEFKVRPLKLQTVRPFVYHEIDLSEKIKNEYCEPSPDGIFEYIDDYIEKTCLPEAKKMLTNKPKQPKQPLIRLKIIYTEDFHVFDTIQLCTKYCDLVANPKDIIMFRRVKIGGQGKTKKENDHTDDLAEELAECFRHNAETAHEWSTTVQSGIKKYFDKKDYKLRVLSLAGMNEALNRCIVSGEDNAFVDVFDYQIKKIVDHLQNRNVDLTTESVIDEVRKYRVQRLGNNGEESEAKEMQNMLNDLTQRTKATKTAARATDMDLGDGSDDDAADAVTSGRGKGRGRGRARGARGTATRGASTRARGRGKKALDVTVFSGPSPKKAATSKVDTAIFNRFANVSSQSHDTSLTQMTRSQRPAVNYISSSDSD